MHIGMSGWSGTGKTSVAKRLAERIRARYLYSGGYMREAAEFRGLTVEEFTPLLAADPSIDRGLDDAMIHAMKECGHCVLDARLAWYIMQQAGVRAFIVRVDCASRIERIVARDMEKERSAVVKKGLTPEIIRTRSAKRDQDDAERFLKLYGIESAFADEHFDLIVSNHAEVPLVQLDAHIDSLVDQVIEEANRFFGVTV